MAHSARLLGSKDGDASFFADAGLHAGQGTLTGLDETSAGNGGGLSDAFAGTRQDLCSKHAGGVLGGDGDLLEHFFRCEEQFWCFSCD